MGIHSSNSSREDQNRFARACVGAAEKLLHDTPNLNAIFGGLCLDGSERSPERTQLAKALGQRGIRVVHWAEADSQQKTSPLLFPPWWYEGAGGSTPATTVSDAMALLDFSQK